MRQYVNGEATSPNHGLSSVESSVKEVREPEAPVDTVEPPLTEGTLPDETPQGDEAAPRPAVEQQPFSAPSMEWDPIQYVRRVL